MRALYLSALTLGLFALGCSSGDSTTGTGGATTSSSGAGDAPVVIGDRSADVHVPASYDPSKPAPLVIVLHGYSVNGFLEEIYLDLTPLSEEYGFLYTHPDGTVDQKGSPFWNATDACCNFFGSTVDDSAYLSALITAIEARYNVDPKRVYLIGHSNGGFMAYRMACDHADQIAGIVSLAGAMTLDPSSCKPSQPVAVLQAHGTKDNEVLYDGTLGDGTPLDGPYPSAAISAKDWASLDGCATTPVAGTPLDLDGAIPGAETTVDKYEQGCQAGTSVELWSIVNGAHIPDIGTTFRHGIIDFLLAHPKP